MVPPSPARARPRYLHEIAPGTLFVEGEREARFPYCNAVLHATDAELLAFDPQCGRARLRRAVKALGKRLPDLTHLVNTHFHVDHSAADAYLKRETDARLYLHPADKPALASVDGYVARYGIKDPAFRAQWRALLGTFGFEPLVPDVDLQEGDVLPGGFRVIHTPGHAPGHCSFFQARTGILVAGDIDLRVPWVSNMSSCVGDFLQSLEKLEQLDIRVLLPAHGPPVTGDFPARFRAYKAEFAKREGYLLNDLASGPRTLEALTRHVMERKGATGAPLDNPKAFFNWHFTKVGTFKLLEHLAEIGRVSSSPAADKPGTQKWTLT